MKSLARRMLAFAITGAFAAFFVERTLTPAGRSAGFTVGVAPSSGGISSPPGSPSMEFSRWSPP